MSAQVYVLEGADATGKSTCAGDIHRVKGGTVVHNGKPDPGLTSRDLFNIYLNQLNHALHLRDVAGLTTVIDRSFLGELIYGRHRAANSLLSPRQVRWLERFCRRNGVRLLGFTADLDERKARIASRGEVWTPVDAFTGAEFAHHFQKSQDLRGRHFWTTVDTSTPAEQ